MPRGYFCSHCRARFSALKNMQRHRAVCATRMPIGSVGHNSMTCVVSATRSILSVFCSHHLSGIASNMVDSSIGSNAWEKMVRSIQGSTLHSDDAIVDPKLQACAASVRHLLGYQQGEGLPYDLLDFLFGELPLAATNGVLADMRVVSVLCRICVGRHIDVRLFPSRHSPYADYEVPSCGRAECRVHELRNPSQSTIVSDEQGDVDAVEGRVSIQTTRWLGPEEAAASFKTRRCLCCSRMFSMHVQSARRADPPRLLVFATPEEINRCATFPREITVLNCRYHLFARICVESDVFTNHVLAKIAIGDSLVVSDDGANDTRFQVRNGLLEERLENSPVVFYRKITMQ
jgi:hypothetical protein